MTYAIVDTAVLITFGGIFPPLSFVICIGIFTRAFYILYFMGKMLSIADELNLSEYSEQLLQDCADIPDIFSKLLWLILPFAALIFSLFIFDTYGDSVTWRKAYWLPLIMYFVPFIFLFLRYIYKLPQIKPTVDKFFDWCRERIPFAKVLLKSRPQDMGLRATVIVSQSTRLSTITFRSPNGITPITPISPSSKDSKGSENNSNKFTGPSNKLQLQSELQLTPTNTNINTNTKNCTNEKKSNNDEENNNIIDYDSENANDNVNTLENDDKSNTTKQIKINQKEDEFRSPGKVQKNDDLNALMEISDV